MPYNSDPMNLSAGTQIGASFLPQISDEERRRRAFARQVITTPEGERFTVLNAPDEIGQEDQSLYADAFRKKLAAQQASPPVARGGIVGGPQFEQRPSRPSVRYGEVEEAIGRARSGREQEARLSEEDIAAERERVRFEKTGAGRRDVAQAAAAEARLAELNRQAARQTQFQTDYDRMARAAIPSPIQQSGPMPSGAPMPDYQPPMNRAALDQLRVFAATRGGGMDGAGNIPDLEEEGYAREDRSRNRELSKIEFENRKAEAGSKYYTSDQRRASDDAIAEARFKHQQGDIAGAKSAYGRSIESQTRPFEVWRGTAVAEDYFGAPANGDELTRLAQEMADNPGRVDSAVSRAKRIGDRAIEFGVPPRDVEAYLHQYFDAVLPEDSPWWTKLLSGLRSAAGATYLPNVEGALGYFEQEEKGKAQQRAQLLPKNRY